MSREVMEMARPFKCPYCGQSNSIGKGVRKTKTMGERRIRLCKACKRKFTPRIQKVEASAQRPDRPAPAKLAVDSRAGETEKPPQAPASGEAVSDSSEEPKPLLAALDREWTS